MQDNKSYLQRKFDEFLASPGSAKWSNTFHNLTRKPYDMVQLRVAIAGIHDTVRQVRQKYGTLGPPYDAWEAMMKQRLVALESILAKEDGSKK